MTELIDLVDDRGYIRAESIPRAEIDDYPDLYVQIAVAVIFSGLGNVLVQKRSLEKKVNPGRQDFVCGVVTSGEDPLKTVRRESHEETGVIPLRLSFLHRGVNSYKRYKYFYVGRTDSERTGAQPSHEVEWAKFLSPDSFDRSKPDAYVDDFFDDLDAARDYLGRQSALSTKPRA